VVLFFSTLFLPTCRFESEGILPDSRPGPEPKEVEIQSVRNMFCSVEYLVGSLTDVSECPIPTIDPPIDSEWDDQYYRATFRVSERDPRRDPERSLPDQQV